MSVSERAGVVLDDPDPLDPIWFLATERFELYRVTLFDVLQPAKEAVAMPGDTGVAVGAGGRGVFDQTDAAIERRVVGSREHRSLDIQARDPQHAERRGGRIVEGAVPGLDARRRPEALVGCAGLALGCGLEHGYAVEHIAPPGGPRQMQRRPRPQRH